MALENVLTTIGTTGENVSSQVADAVAPNAANKTPVVVAVAMVIGFGIAFAFRKKLMKPVIRYRNKRRTRMTKK